jgi:L-alanine-DL-glutamate epimerase-like enolase superfamily enzyme
MKIIGVETRPLRVAYKKPFYWAKGVIDAAEVVLVSVHTDSGITGYGESMSSVNAEAVQLYLREAGDFCIGRSPFEVTPLLAQIYHHLFTSRGNCSSPRFGALVLAGLDMALWDLAGKATGCPIHQLLGGAVREHIQYFGFPQGKDANEVAAEAADWCARGAGVIYVKIGHGPAEDFATASKVREAIGTVRLRLDANEAWDVLTAKRMIRGLAQFDIEFIEQPTDSNSVSALAAVRASSPIPIAADQSVFTPEDAMQVCVQNAADLIVIGLHETGGVDRLRKVAAVAESAGINVCLHGLYETGITTCATHQVGVTLKNLDDGNQYMNHFLVEDIIKMPDLTLRNCQLPLLFGPGLGFELDWDAVARAEAAYQRHKASNASSTKLQ